MINAHALASLKACPVTLLGVFGGQPKIIATMKAKADNCHQFNFKSCFQMDAKDKEPTRIKKVVFKTDAGIKDHSKRKTTNRAFYQSKDMPSRIFLLDMYPSNWFQSIPMTITGKILIWGTHQ